MHDSRNEYIHEASNAVFRQSAYDLFRKRCLDREEYYQDLRNYERVIAQKDAAIAQKDAVIAEKDALLQKTISETERLRSLLKEHGISNSE